MNAFFGHTANSYEWIQTSLITTYTTLKDSYTIKYFYRTVLRVSQPHPSPSNYCISRKEKMVLNRRVIKFRRQQQYGVRRFGELSPPYISVKIETIFFIKTKIFGFQCLIIIYCTNISEIIYIYSVKMREEDKNAYCQTVCRAVALSQ